MCGRRTVPCRSPRKTNITMTISTNDVGQAFLRWLYEHASEHPNPENFLKDAPEIHGEPISEADLTRVVVRAEHHGMLKGHKAMGSPMPLRVRLLPSGEVCVEDFDGDIRKWEEAQRGGPTVSTGDSYTFSGVSNSQIVAGSKNIEQTQTITVNDPELLHRLGVAAQELADLLDGKEDVHELREAATEVVRTAKDPARTAEAGRAGKRLHNALNVLLAASASSTIATFLIELSGHALGSP